MGSEMCIRDSGNVDQEPVSIIVNSEPNTEPIASFDFNCPEENCFPSHDGDPETDSVDITVTSTSVDPDDDSISCMWYHNNSYVDDPNCGSFTFTAQAEESYDVSLYVTDSYGLATNVSGSINIGTEPNEFPGVFADDDKEVTCPHDNQLGCAIDVEVCAQGSDDDQEDVLSYLLSLIHI